MTLNIPEIVAPAGNLEKLSIALNYGADTVYLGGKDFNLRAKSGNFTDPELKQAVDLIKSKNKRVYVTLNSLLRNSKIESLKSFIKYLDSLKVDGVIVSDLGTFSLVKEESNLNIHISTQASVTNWKSARTWYNLGAKRIVLARELSLEEIAEIKQKVPELELEVFIHGAMCMAYSGRCNLSLYLAERSANEGECTHSCRWKYYLSEEKRRNEYLPVYEDETGSFIYSSKDLCTIDFLDKIVSTGVSALKIEGRMKGLLYIATTVNVYRTVLDMIFSKKDPDTIKSIIETIKPELSSYTNRGYTSGFYFGKLDNGQRYDILGYDKEYELVAKVTQDLGNNSYLIEIRNRLVAGTEVEVISPYKNLDNYSIQKFIVPIMIDPDTNEELDIVSPTRTVKITTDVKLHPLDLIRQALG